MFVTVHCFWALSAGHASVKRRLNPSSLQKVNKNIQTLHGWFKLHTEFVYEHKVATDSWLITALYSHLLYLCEKWIRASIWRNIYPSLGGAVELLAFPFQFLQLTHSFRTWRGLGQSLGLIGHLLCKREHFSVVLLIDGGVFRLVRLQFISDTLLLSTVSDLLQWKEKLTGKEMKSLCL